MPHPLNLHHLTPLEQTFNEFDVFDDDGLQPEKDPSLLASFLNSNMMSIFNGKNGKDEGQTAPTTPPEQMVMQVELPAGLPKETLRDAMLQWRMRHTAHPLESEAIDWLLSQLDPSGFGLLAVKVPAQLRSLLLEALISHSQRHAELQLDACHATRVQQTLQQLEKGAAAAGGGNRLLGRYQSIDVELPDDDKGTERVRELLYAALKARIEGGGAADASTPRTEDAQRDITQEEGYLLQSTMAVLAEPYSLLALPCDDKEGGRNADNVEEQLEALRNEIRAREDAIRKDAVSVWMWNSPPE